MERGGKRKVKIDSGGGATMGLVLGWAGITPGAGLNGKGMHWKRKHG